MKNRLVGILQWIAMLAFVLVVIVIAQWITPLAAMNRYLAAHPPVNRVLIGAMAGIAAVGLFLLVGTQVFIRVGDEVVTAEQSPMQYSLSISFTDRASFRRVKEAWQKREWKENPRWQRLFLMMLGGILMTIGLFGLLFVIGPPFIKLLSALAVVYALVRSVGAFARA